MPVVRGVVTQYSKADEYESLAEYEHEVARLQSRRLEDLRPKVQWVDNHRSEIEAAAGKWALLCTFSQNIRAGFDFGSALALDVFVCSADLASMDLSQLIGRGPQ